jgi:hypothetical protein
VSEHLTVSEWLQSLSCALQTSTRRMAAAAYAMQESILRSETGWALFRWRAGLQCTKRQYVKAGRSARERMLRRAARRRGARVR